MDALHTSEIVGALQEQSAALSTERELLPLDVAERVVAYPFRGEIYRHFFRRLTAEDAACYFSNSPAEVKQEKTGVKTTAEHDTAAAALYRRAALRAEGKGFMARDGRRAHELPTWPECLLVRHANHCVTAASFLLSAYGVPADDFIEAEGACVTLHAIWNEAGPGEMRIYKDLVHKFAAPKAEHRRRLMRARSETLIVGGSRAGATIIRSCWGVISALYDELIVGVEGYALGGAPLAGREAIAREMDPFHKNAAINELFPPALEPDSSGGKE